ncbi:uncharacterized protein LOC129248184 [Anastrepha obliqua]|uniref:uncharacterized protein LOC129248184 n=1 Tax=Anastrepha obliqua TaxID=95512 RepID=UPI00240908B6|nr:uncharacterized protein LOC129248184 [Anastrepha obliqua]
MDDQKSENNAPIMKSAVSEIESRIRESILHSPSPRGLMIRGCGTKEAVEKYDQLNAACSKGLMGHVDSKKMKTKSASLLKYIDYNYDRFFNNQNYIELNKLQSEAISLKIKEEPRDQTNMSDSEQNDTKSIKLLTGFILNPCAALSKNRAVKGLDLKKKELKKQELIEQNTDANTGPQIDYLQTVQDNKFMPEISVQIGNKKLAGQERDQLAQKDIEPKIIKEQFEKRVETFEGKGKEHKKRGKWRRNPFALIASETKKYALRESVRGDQKIKESPLKDTEIKFEYSKPLFNATVKNEWSDKLHEIKLECRNSAIDSESHRLSDFDSLHNTYFDSLTQIGNAVGSSLSTNIESQAWLAKLAEHPCAPIKIVKRSTSIEIYSAEKPKWKCNKKTEGKQNNSNKNKLAKIKQINKTKPKSNCRTKSNTESQHNYSQKSTSETRKICRKNPKRKRRRRIFANDKAYSCPITNEKLKQITCSADGRMHLRVRKNKILSNGLGTSFPKPMLEEKPEIATPPAPIQIKAIKPCLDINCEGTKSSYEPLPLEYQKRNASKSELDCLRNVEKDFKNQFLSHTNYSEVNEAISNLQKSVKTEIDCNGSEKLKSCAMVDNAAKLSYDVSVQPRVRLRSMNVKRKLSASFLETHIKREMIPRTVEVTGLSQPCKFLKSMNPRVCLKRLPPPKNVGCLEPENSCPMTLRTESIAKIENHVKTPTAANCTTSNNIEASSKAQINSSVCLKRLPLPKYLHQSKLPDTCHINIKAETIPETHVMDKPLSAVKNSNAYSGTKITPKNKRVLDLENCKFLQSLQPQVRLKRLNFHGRFLRSTVAKRITVSDSIQVPSNLKPLVRLRRLKLVDLKMNHYSNNQKIENNTKQLKVDLKVKRKCNFYEKNARCAPRKRKMYKMHIKEEKLSPKRNALPITPTSQLRIAQAFSLQPIVRVNRLTKFNQVARRHSNRQSSVKSTELETQVKSEALDASEEELTPVSFAKQYEEEDSGVLLDSIDNANTSFHGGQPESTAGSKSPAHTKFATDDILLKIAFQRACINDLLLRNGYSAVQFRLYNKIEELKIFLDYLLAK